MPVLSSELRAEEPPMKSSETSTQTEEESFNFSELIQQLREARSTTTNKQGKFADMKRNYDFKVLANDKEAHKENYDNSSENASTEEDSEVELSWRPLDELALKDEYLRRKMMFFRPMGSLIDDRTGQVGEIENERRATCNEMLHSGNNSKWNLYNTEKVRNTQSMLKNTLSQENDIEYYHAEDLLKSIKYDIKNTKERVEHINDYIKNRVGSELGGNGHAEDEVIPGGFRETSSNRDYLLPPSTDNSTFSSTITNIKWILLLPLKWKAVYFSLYHLMTFSDDNYSLIKNCHNIAAGPGFLTISEVDKLFGCYMTFEMFSQNFQSFTCSFKELFECVYQYFLFYDDLHPILRKGWKEVFLYGLLNVMLIVLGASALNFFWIPTQNSSPIYHCLWEIGFGSSQKFGLVIMLMTFYIDLTRKGLKEFEKEADKIARKEQDDNEERIRVSESTSVNQNSRKDYFENQNEEILLESTPSYFTKYWSHQSPLLRKSCNINQENSLNVVSISTFSDADCVKTSEGNVAQIDFDSKGFSNVVLKIVTFLSSFLRAPWRMTRIIFSLKFTETLRRYLSSTVHQFGRFSR